MRRINPSIIAIIVQATNNVHGQSVSVHQEVLNINGCAQYRSFENVKEAIDDLGVFEKFQDIVAYARVPYANEYLLNGKNIPSERYLRAICTLPETGKTTTNVEILNTRFISISVGSGSGSGSDDGGVSYKSNSGNGCEYPYFKMDSVEHTTHAVGPEDLFVEYKVCTRMDTCSISADTIALGAGEKRDRPIEENCIFSIYAPSRKA